MIAVNADEIRYPARIGRIFFLALASILIVLPALLAQDVRGIELTIAQPSIELSMPSVVSATVVVRNTTAQRQRYQGSLVVPDHWRRITSSESFELGPNESDVRLLNIAIPPGAPAGVYQVIYTARDQATPPHQSSISLQVVLKPVVLYDLQLFEAPRFVTAGKPYRVSFILANKGNTAGGVRLSVHNSHDFESTLENSTISLLARETKTIVVSVFTGTESGEKISNTIELRAQPLQDSSRVLKAAAIVDVIPQLQKLENLYLMLPVELRVRSTGDEFGSRQQVEFFGAGTLSESRRDRLEFLVRSPETQRASVLGMRDEYRLRYEGAGFDVQLGDWNYALSSLTEQNRYAAGILARVHFNKLHVGGFTNRTRGGLPMQQETAGFFSYEITNDIELGANYLKRHEAVDSDILTARGLFRPWMHSHVEAEVGRSSSVAGSENAFALHLSGNEPWLSYDARYVDAGPKYTGYYRDVNLRSLSVNFFPWVNVRLETTYRDEQRNLEQDTAQFYAPRDRYEQIGIGYSNIVSLSYRISLQEDRLLLSKYRRQENTAQLHLGYSMAGFGLFANADVGRTEDRLLNKQYPFQRYALNVNATPSASQNYSVSLEHFTDLNPLTDERQERYSGTLTAWVLLGSATQVQLNCFAGRFVSSSPQSNAFIDMTISQELPFHHHIVIRGRQTYYNPTIDSRDRAYSVEYGVPIGIPLKRLSSVGQLRGRVTDNEGRGVANILINAGSAAAVTDNDGNYFFASLTPGRQFVVVDRSSVGLDRVTVQSMPMETEIWGGVESRVDIGLVRSGQVDGSVRLFNFVEEGADTSLSRTTEAGGVQSIVLEMSNGSDVQRRVSDSQGRFLFADLRPGNWTLTIVGGELPAFHAFERENLELTVKPGEQETLSLNVVPRRRMIQFIQEGTIVQEKPTAVSNRSKKATTPSSPCLVSYDSKKGGFILQVSSWATNKKAMQHAQAAQRSYGFTAFVESVDVPTIGMRYHVFLSVFKTRQEAEAICRKVQQSEAE